MWTCSAFLHTTKVNFTVPLANTKSCHKMPEHLDEDVRKTQGNKNKEEPSKGTQKDSCHSPSGMAGSEDKIIPTCVIAAHVVRTIT